ncbi:M50 family metallopeptidase [Sporohalobacter salinus]|uniref:M50 family metallopeptidase n=1 Tax=Sporohalobacter salinus TaxID=1494606 RepID=UPI00195F589F|nr:M50 family metallopeptidase [Sporohalobacter salinus]MBM7623103.1 stage IV sporulation protein FB [Sporohalobacter salinus]
MYIIKVLGVKIKLNLLFLVVILVFGYFHLLDKAIITFGSAFLHELTHVAVAKSNDIGIDEVELLPFGGVAKYNDLLELDPEVEIKTAIAGPFCNLFLAVVMVICLRYSFFKIEWGLFFIKTNFVIAFFNLFPALPLDGGRIFRAFKTMELGFRQATKLTIQLSKYLAIAIGILALIGIWLGYFNIILLIIAFFIYTSTSKENRNNIYVLMRYLTRKKRQLKERKILRNEELVVIETTKIKDIIEKFKPKFFHTIVVVDNNLNIIVTLTEEEIITALLERGINSQIKELI